MSDLDRHWEPENYDISDEEKLAHHDWASEHKVGVTIDAGGFFQPYWRNCSHDGGTHIPDDVLHSGDGEAINAFWDLVDAGEGDWEAAKDAYPEAVGVVEDGLIRDYPSLAHAIKGFRMLVTEVTGIDVTYDGENKS